MIAEKSIRRFLKELASNHPVPGGGSVSSVVAAQAAGLVSMACEISLKREGPGKKRKRLKKLGEAARRLVSMGLKLAERDGKVFSRLIHCFKRRYASPSARGKAIQRAIGICTTACLDLAFLARDGMRLTRETVRWVRPDMRSEIYTALYLWEAAFHGAKVNTEANLRWVKDKGFRARSRNLVRRVSVLVRRDRRAILKALGR